MRQQERDRLSTVGLRAALQVRKKTGFPPEAPLCVYEVADSLGLQVRFCDINSLGGMFSAGHDLVLLPARRPPGRQAFSCAHEVGHWRFEHGSKVDSPDDLVPGQFDKREEFLANAFAGFLLMPRAAVQDALARRGWRASELMPLQVLLIACQLGVGYTTLIHHLNWSLHLLAQPGADRLLHSSPKAIRSELGLSKAPRVVPVDLAWHSVTVDLRVGDVAILPEESHLEGVCLRAIGTHEKGLVIEACCPGIGRAENHEQEWATYVRVCRADYHGLAAYRHMEDPDDDV